MITVQLLHFLTKFGIIIYLYKVKIIMKKYVFPSPVNLPFFWQWKYLMFCHRCKKSWGRSIIMSDEHPSCSSACSIRNKQTTDWRSFCITSLLLFPKFHSSSPPCDGQTEPLSPASQLSSCHSNPLANNSPYICTLKPREADENALPCPPPGMPHSDREITL